MPFLPGRRTTLVLSALLIVAFGCAVAWRIVVACDAGWIGLTYSSPMPPESRLANFQVLGMGPSNVAFVLLDSKAYAAGVRAGDRVVSINGVPAYKTAAIAAIAARARRGDQLMYRLSRNGKEREVRLPLVSPLSFMNLVTGLITSVLCFAVFVAASLIVFWSRPRSRAARVFYWLCTAGAAFFAAATMGDLDVIGFRGIEAAGAHPAWFTLYGIYALLSLLLTNLILHLALVFPKELPILTRHSRILVWVHTFSFLPITCIPFIIVALKSSRHIGSSVLAGAVLAAIPVIVFANARRAAADRGWRGAILDRPLTVQLALISVMTLPLAVIRLDERHAFAAGMVVGFSFVFLILAIFLIYSISTIAALVAGYRSSGIEEKRQARWPLWGLGVCVGAVTLCSFLLIVTNSLAPELRSVTFVVSNVILRAFYVIIPIAFAFGILKYRLMDIDVIIRKTVVYSIVTAETGISFFIFVAGLGSWLTAHFKIHSQTFTVVSTLILAALVVPVRNRVQRFIDRRLFRRKYDTTDAAKLIQHEILRASDLRPLLQKIAETLQQSLQCRSVVLFVDPNDEDRFVPEAAIGVAGELLAGLELERSAIPSTATVVSASSLRLREDEWLRMRKLHAELFVPMALRGRLRGVMLLGSLLGGARYDDDDRLFLSSVAEQIALGIDNLTVGDEVRDFERALEIQKSLLPKSMPRVAGLDIEASWRPARTVGGDYFDVLPLGSSLGICIGDVAGKGMPAALMMSSLQAAVRASVSESITPSELCTKVRNVVCGTLAGGKFVTFFFAILDPDALALRYTNAGHNPPMLLKSDGRVIRLDRGGPVFARLMSDADYCSGEVALDPGDVLVLFTDGVTEARSADEEEFGEQRLVNSVRQSPNRAGAVVHNILENVRNFSEGVVHDDLTVLCVRVSRETPGNVVAFERFAQSR
ncbi:MAG TPA: SpoIIE family protein phosphatase [Thermoanaerobaculia bacterium]|nr:SpoIIE family protein phosphatase [Thermoanaerobaculia bacterium]